MLDVLLLVDKNKYLPALPLLAFRDRNEPTESVPLRSELSVFVRELA